MARNFRGQETYRYVTKGLRKPPCPRPRTFNVHWLFSPGIRHDKILVGKQSVYQVRQPEYSKKKKSRYTLLRGTVHYRYIFMENPNHTEPNDGSSRSLFFRRLLNDRPRLTLI